MSELDINKLRHHVKRDLKIIRIIIDQVKDYSKLENKTKNQFMQDLDKTLKSLKQNCELIKENMINS